ncbi:hypothetical protein, partial [Achromobacter xylosoxidans]|uniref:hypothetical protein n=1 Tax=Alcaligenes xylosoxydans xylosoxydans TaxID=85698 RepID=UPI001F139084
GKEPAHCRAACGARAAADVSNRNFPLVFSLIRSYNCGTFNHPEIIVDNDGCSRYTTACAA